jgi:hypothetical protein
LGNLGARAATAFVRITNATGAVRSQVEQFATNRVVDQFELIN